MDNLLSVKQRFGIIGRSEALDRALFTALRVANTDLSVLITGESGVGKEIFSRIIHEHSARKHNKFIAINCGAIPEGTINSELFGHEKGAFTGATGERKGYFETYDGGTIFLDEIGEMPLDTQAFLLRVLETGEFIRVGSSKTLKTDVRIIAATNVELEDKIRKNKFRDDLFYRLNTVPIKIPSLRERREDIYLLFRKFSIDFSERYRGYPIELDDEARKILEAYSWPGNIRELKNIAEQLSVLSEERSIDAERLMRYAPQLFQRHLPMIPDTGAESSASFQEREILYKLLFDMKADLNDLKSLVFELVRTNDLEMPNGDYLKSIQPPPLSTHSYQERPIAPSVSADKDELAENNNNPFKPIIIENLSETAYDDSEEVDETLSLAENEKGLIKRALKKHSGKRKEAAHDLGISERTLYRKIKEYNL